MYYTLLARRQSVGILVALQASLGAWTWYQWKGSNLSLKLVPRGVGEHLSDLKIKERQTLA
ncbi:hypothetical protein V5O48_009036 [Marasmius crinis-equi]|uniref:Uncharacterized protein n=1 Tax=Marasmius crinis-equi TaxID=585013 RepID=A0ABR3FC91_9AGAR